MVKLFSRLARKHSPSTLAVLSKKLPPLARNVSEICVLIGGTWHSVPKPNDNGFCLCCVASCYYSFVLLLLGSVTVVIRLVLGAANLLRYCFAVQFMVGCKNGPCP